MAIARRQSGAEVWGLQKYRLEWVSIDCGASIEVEWKGDRPSSRWRQFVCRKKIFSAVPAEVSPTRRICQTRHLSAGQGAFLPQLSTTHSKGISETKKTKTKNKLLTNHVVAILVADQRLKRALPLLVQNGQNIDNLLTLIRCAELNTLLHHVARKLMLGKVREVPGDQGYDLGPVLFPAMLDHMLRHIIPVLINDQCRRAGVEFVQDGRPGGFFAVFQHALNHSTTIRVHGQAVHLAGEGVDDELDVDRRNSLDGLLYHMVAILVFDAFEHILFEFSDQLRLLIGQNMLKGLISLAGSDTPPHACRSFTHLLDHSTPIHLQ